MKKEEVDKVMERIESEWEKRYGKENIDPEKVKATRMVLEESPHKRGLMPVTSMETGKTYMVPMEDIILKGLKGSDVHKYPEKK